MLLKFLLPLGVDSNKPRVQQFYEECERRFEKTKDDGYHISTQVNLLTVSQVEAIKFGSCTVLY